MFHLSHTSICLQYKYIVHCNIVCTTTIARLLWIAYHLLPSPPNHLYLNIKCSTPNNSAGQMLSLKIVVYRKGGQTCTIFGVLKKIVIFTPCLFSFGPKKIHAIFSLKRECLLFFWRRPNDNRQSVKVATKLAKKHKKCITRKQSRKTRYAH